ncbi:hypothetical protein V502_01233 [Pseudogymnoascus sp. VKM F-4520 (FW-2644)]|nr:hypothetical protein V502_01233 [Pseudogymnoascus sp. VKM F-4520 (FW-2644)]
MERRLQNRASQRRRRERLRHLKAGAHIIGNSQSSIQHQSKTGGTRGSSIQEPEDNILGLRSSPSITVSAPPSKRPRGRPRKKPLQPEKPRTARAHIVSDPAIISTSKPIITIPSSSRQRALRSAAPTDHNATDSVVHKLGKKRKRTLSGDVCPTVLQTVCEGCRRKSYPHGENWKQGLITICHKCNKEWHAQCMARKGIQRGGAPGQWECRDCSRKGKPQPPRPAHTHDTEMEVMLDQQARDTASETDPGVLSLGTNIILQELDTPHITDYYGHLLNFSKTNVFQAQNAYEEARGLLKNVLSEREKCRGRFYKLKTEIEQFGNELEEHRRHFNSDGVYPGDGESKHSMTQRLVLGISADGDWTDKISAKIDLIRAEERRLTERVKSLQGDAKMKKATLKGVEQQRSMYSTCLETSCKEFEKLRSQVSKDLIGNSLEDSDFFSESTVEDSIADSATSTSDCDTTHSATADISSNGIVRGIERPAEEANQQHMMKNPRSTEERRQMRGEHVISAEEFELPQLRSQRSLIVVLRYTPATDLARASNICGISRVLEQPEKADEREIRGSSLSLETDRVPGQPGPFIAAEAIQEPQGLPQLEPVQAPKQSDTANSTSLQEALSQLSNITIHMPSTSDLVDEREGRGSSQLSEVDQVPEQLDPFNAAEAIQEPQGLPQTLEPVKAPKQSDIANKTSPQEALSQHSNITIHMPSTSDLVEGRNQQQNVSLATSLSQQPDQSCTPEVSRRTQDPHPVTFASIPAASAPSSGDFDRPKSSEPSSLSLTPEDTSIITGDRNSEEPHSHGPVLDGMAQSAENQYSADVVVQQRPEHQSSRQAEADLTSISASYERLSRSKFPPPFLGLNSSPSPANLVHNKVVLPPITSFSPTRDALQSSALPSLTPQTHLVRTSISSNTLGQYATNGNLQTPVRDLTVSEAGTGKHVCTGPFWRPSPSFQERITNLLVDGIDDTEIPTPAGVIYRRDLRTLVPHVGHISDMIINEYLKCLAQYTNARRESDIPDSCDKIAMIGSMDPIPPGLLKCLNAFSAIYLPFKWNTHWILAVLYPGSRGRQGRAEVYDSHWHWANSSMTASFVFQLLKSRLGDEFSAGDWAASVQQRSRPQRSDADSGLYVLANAKSIALTLGMVDLESRARSLSLRWQFAQELVTQSVVEAF